MVGETDNGRVALGTFYATERRERGAAHRVLIEPSLDDPCTALCVIDGVSHGSYRNLLANSEVPIDLQQNYLAMNFATSAAHPQSKTAS